METLDDALTFLSLFWHSIGVQSISTRKILSYPEIYEAMKQRFPTMSDYSRAFTEIPYNYQYNASYSLRNFMPGNTLVTFRADQSELITTVWGIIFEKDPYQKKLQEEKL